MSTQDDDTLRPADQVTLLVGRIQWLASSLDKLNADLRVSAKAQELGEIESDYLDFDEMHQEGREQLQETAEKLRDIYEDLAAFLNRRDAVSGADVQITDGTLDHLPDRDE